MLGRITTIACLCAASYAGAQTTREMKQRDTPASLQREAKVTMAAARATALREVPNGNIKEAELEREKGKLIYSFDIKIAGKGGVEEVAVDALTGAVISHEHETPQAEAKEAALEKKGKQKK